MYACVLKTSDISQNNEDLCVHVHLLERNSKVKTKDKTQTINEDISLSEL